jgi:Family of unknown function (DUF6090)
MIKFFRNIRQRLLSENKFNKYLFYALGEIVLVVIGILIALQLNNWNEAQKRRALEVQIYKEIHQDLSLTYNEVELDRNAHVSLILCTDSLLSHLVHKEPYNEKVVSGFLCAVTDLQVYPKTSGFDALKSIGLDLLTNDTLRSRITDLHQLALERVIAEGKQFTQTTNLQEIMNPFLDKYLTGDVSVTKPLKVTITPDSILTLNGYGLMIKDYDALLADTKLISMLNRVQIIRNQKMQRHNMLLRAIRQTINAIEQELVVLDPNPSRP